MNSPVFVPREQAIANARRALDAARARRDADYVAGQLTGRRLEVYEQLLAERAAREATAQVEDGDPRRPRSLVIPREQCIANLRAEATKVIARLALAEAEGRLTEREAAVVARIRARMAAGAAEKEDTAAHPETDGR